MPIMLNITAPTLHTGKETKLMMNSGKTAFKRTATDKLLNILILGVRGGEEGGW